MAGFWEIRELLPKPARLIEFKRATASGPMVSGLEAKGNLNKRAKPVKVSQVGILRVRAYEAAKRKFRIRAAIPEELREALRKQTA